MKVGHRQHSRALGRLNVEKLQYGRYLHPFPCHRVEGRYILDPPNIAVERISISEMYLYFDGSILKLDSQPGPVDVDENRVSITMPPDNG